MFSLGSLVLPLTIGVLFPSLLGLQSALSLMLAACLQDESPLRSGMAPPSLGLPGDALPPLGVGVGNPGGLRQTPAFISASASWVMSARSRVCACGRGSRSAPSWSPLFLLRAWKPRAWLRMSDHNRCPQPPPYPRGLSHSWEDGWPPPILQAEAGNPALVPGHQIPACKRP